jgi:hypothetical protein
MSGRSKTGWNSLAGIGSVIMQQSIIHVALVVRDYDEAIAFYCDRLHFKLIEDTYNPTAPDRRPHPPAACSSWSIPSDRRGSKTGVI